jgi:hypothetical protein
VQAARHARDFDLVAARHGRIPCRVSFEGELNDRMAWRDRQKSLEEARRVA